MTASSPGYNGLPVELDDAALEIGYVAGERPLEISIFIRQATETFPSASVPW